MSILRSMGMELLVITASTVVLELLVDTILAVVLQVAVGAGGEYYSGAAANAVRLDNVLDLVWFELFPGADAVS